MSAAYTRRKEFADTLNRLIGVQKPVLTDKQVKDMLSDKASQTEASNRSVTIKPAFANAMNKTTKEKADKITEQEKLDFLKARGKEADDNRPWWKRWGGEVMDSISRPLDIFARPSYAAFDAVKRTANALDKGEPIYSLGDNFLYGLRRGIQGQDKTGFGTALQAIHDVGLRDLAHPFTSRSSEGEDKESTIGSAVYEPFFNKIDRYTHTTPIGAITDFMELAGNKEVQKTLTGSGSRESSHPDAYKQAMRIGGFEGDLGLDPLNTVGAPLLTKAFGKAGREGATELIKAGAKAAEDTAPWLADVGNEAARREVAREALTRDFKNGTIDAQTYLDEYAKEAPHSQVVKDVKSGKRTIDDAAASLVANQPVIPADVYRAAKPKSAAIIDDVESQVDNFLYQMKDGKFIGGNPKEVPNQIAHLVTEGARAQRLEPVERAIADFKQSRGTLKSWTAKKLAEAKANIPHFETWHDTYMKEMAGRTVVPANVKAAENAADQVVMRAVSTEMAEINAVAKKAVEDGFQRVPSLKLAGKTVAEFPRLRAAALRANELSPVRTVTDAMNKGFNYASNFPGFSSLLAGENRARAIQQFEKFRKDFIDTINQLGLTKEELKTLQHNLDDGIVGTGKMEAAYNHVRSIYDDMYNAEVAAGVRPAMSVRDPNYTHIQVKSSKDGQKGIEKWKRARKDAMTRGRKANLDGLRTADAIKQGYRVEENAGNNVLHAMREHLQKLNTTNFERDLYTHYGIRANMTPAEAHSRNLVAMTNTKKEGYILQAMQDTLKPGEKLYLDKDIHNILKNYREMLQAGNNQTAPQLIRALDRVTSMFKTMNTIYFPGYHIRNMIGDMFMGAIDGVDSKLYTEVMTKYLKRDKGAVIEIAGKQIPMNKLLDDYYEHAGSSGFFHTELEHRATKAVTQKIRKASEMREDYGRFVHFVHALKEEAPSAKNWDHAVNNAVARVNKFKFDYSALTPFELKYMRRGIPFYTYMRKAVPTLLESMLVNPKYYSRLAKLQNQFSDWGDQEIPDWAREIGYLNFGKGYGVDPSFLPTNVLNEATNNPMSRTHPFLQIMSELNSGKDSFTGAPFSKTDETGLDILPQVLKSKWRGFNFIDKLKGDDLDGVEKLGTFLGISTRKMDEGETKQKMAELTFKLNNEMERLSATLESKGYSVYFSDSSTGYSLKVKDKITGEVLKTFKSIPELEAYIKDL